MPCTYTKECSIVKDTNIEQSHSSKDHSQSKEHCTPFCTCACCSASVVVSESTCFQIKNSKEFSSSQKNTTRNFSFVSSYFASIWQPPKISA